MTRKTTKQVGNEGLPLLADSVLTNGALVFHLPRSRSTDPATSHAAGESMLAEAHAQRSQIAAYLLDHPSGKCCDRIDEGLGFRDGRAGKRVPEMCDEGIAVMCDGKTVTLDGTQYNLPELRQQTRSGRWALIAIHRTHLDPTWRL